MSFIFDYKSRSSRKTKKKKRRERNGSRHQAFSLELMRLFIIGRE